MASWFIRFNVGGAKIDYLGLATGLSFMENAVDLEPIVIRRGGCQLIGIWHLPRHSREKTPCVLFTHGYGGSKVGSKRLYVQMARALAEVGIAALRFDFRGCGDSDGDFSSVTVSELVADACEVLCVIKKRFIHVGILGISLGAAIATMAAREVGWVESLALWAAVASGQVWLEDWSRHYPDQVIANGISCGGVVAGREFRREFLLINLKQELALLRNIPLLHVQAGRDRTVFEGHGQIIKEARRGSQSKFLLLPESDHFFTHEEERKILISETTRWFKETLPAV